ncbi:MAG: hypothetical protein JWO57_2584 [Pseudonocardiales bacterium]|nr:hypothetical protein [Pseudonocardiales bacterium]
MYRRRLVVLGVVLGIAAVDQVFKWWAWRHAPGVRVNYGGDSLVPSSVGSLYARPVTGAVLDLVDSGLLILAVVLFLRRSRPIAVSISGSMVVGGWSSNLLDRLVMHYWSAPGSVRGVVDFIPIGRHHYNVADLFIISGTPVFVLAAGGSFVRRVIANRPSTTAGVTPRTHRPRQARRILAAVAAYAAVATAVGFGAADFGGASSPVTSASATYQPVFVSRHGITSAMP